MKIQGDSDTNCCIVGGIVGAYVGIDRIDTAETRKLLECELSEQRREDVISARRPKFVQPAKGCINEMIELIRISPTELDVVTEYVTLGIRIE